MPYSMTGFASKQFTITAPSGEQSNISVSLKSLNARFFECTIKLPLSLSHLETKLFKLFQSTLKRGNIYCTVYLSNPDIFGGTVTPAINMITSYTDAIKKIKTELKLSDPIMLENILRLPNIFSTESQQLDTKTVELFLREIQIIIDAVIQERLVEGASLKADLQQRLTTIQNEITIIEQRAAIIIEERKKKVHTTLQEIGTDETLLANAQKDALYTMLDKIDIHEEITRIKSHIHNFLSTLEISSIEKGKRLDFILQELGRETNTISAKCSDSTTSSHTITMKVEIEKMREQVQNIV